jgi:hypothetical protein
MHAAMLPGAYACNTLTFTQLSVPKCQVRTQPLLQGGIHKVIYCNFGRHMHAGNKFSTEKQKFGGISEKEMEIWEDHNYNFQMLSL